MSALSAKRHIQCATLTTREVFAGVDMFIHLSKTPLFEQDMFNALVAIFVGCDSTTGCSMQDLVWLTVSLYTKLL